MKVSLKTVKYYTGGELDLSDVDGLVAKIGAQLGAVEEVIDYGKRYEGVVVAKVVKCEKHPDADKLSVCEIDAGTGENVQVVCGAPNVREGLTVAWIPPGATVPATHDKDPFVLEAREIRGVVSNGMLASPSELAISDSHEGLLEISAEDVGENNMTPGTPFKNLYGLDDTVIDIENKMFTHRPDCFGVLGVAREIAGIYGHEFTTPDWYLKIPQIFLKSSKSEIVDTLKLEVKNEIPNLVPRFMAVAMSDVAIKPSPVWVQALLTRIGIKSINNVVDMTNHLAYVTGQPLHAYDYDKVKNLSGDITNLTVRLPKEGETIALLNGKTIAPRSEAIMIATDKELIGIGGVMGGTTTGVDENTKNIIIECANFDMYSIRRTSMEHGLFTDAVTRNNKGQSPLQNDRVIVKMMEDVKQIAGGKQASDVIDVVNFPQEMYDSQSINSKVVASAEFINSRLGLELSSEEIKQLLRNVGFACLEEGAEGEIEFYAPFWRTDIEIKEDIVEEVGRLLGYDKMPQVLPKKGVAPAIIDSRITVKNLVRNKLASFGANEILTYSFVHGNLLEKAGQDPEMAFKLSNAISPDLQYYRLSLTPSLLNVVYQNIKAGHDKFALFELGNVHNKSMVYSDLPLEKGTVALVYFDKNSTKDVFFRAKKYVSQLVPNAQFLPYTVDEMSGAPSSKEMVKPFDVTRSAVVVKDDKMVGVVGEFDLNVLNKLKLPNSVAGFELYLDELGDTNQLKYVPLSRFPSISQDICLEVEDNVSYVDLKTELDSSSTTVCPEDCGVELQLIDMFKDENIGNKKRITFRLTLSSYDRTLSEDVMSRLVSGVVDSAVEKLHALQI